MYYLLYEITNLVNGKTYIGQHITKNVNDDYMGSGVRIKAAIKKYGLKNFKKEILLYAKNEVALNFFEKALVTPEFIEKENTYNLKEGGGNGKLSEHVKEKISLAHRGKKHSLETKTKISLASKKRKHSLETKIKIGLARKGKKLSPEWIAKIQTTKILRGTTNTGTKRSLETKAKMSVWQKGKKKSPEHVAKIWKSRRKNQLLKTINNNK